MTMSRFSTGASDLAMPSPRFSSTKFGQDGLFTEFNNQNACLGRRIHGLSCHENLQD